MDISEKIERSKSNEKIDFTKISCMEVNESLVPVVETEKIIVEPIWTLKDDFEGGMYADYIAEHPVYDQIYVRQELLKRLNAAADLIPERYKIVVRAGHRPLEVQKRLLDENVQEYLAEHPEAAKEEALNHARTFISDPDIKLPPHCCGSAVDIELFDTRTQSLVDFGSPINLDEEISYLHSDLVNHEHRQNRNLSLEAMLESGFASYYAEWWHFSYGDEIWA
jgi:zinc D-Ala-D-Ala dipeptidase